MNEIMGKLGLSGKAFVPMLLGFGCSIPAIMATRTLQSEKDRKKTILITPFMSCSAKLPIYILFAEMFFSKYATLVTLSIYVLGIVLGICLAFILEKLSPSTNTNALLIELPEYRFPSAHTVFIYVWDKIRDYITRAGTIIFLATILLWFALNYNAHGAVTDISQSFGASIGRWVVPIMAPAGLGLWQVVLALISGLASKETVVASFSVLFGIANVNSTVGMNNLADQLATYGFGTANALAIMVFCLLYTPCASAIGTVKNETKSWKWTMGMMCFQLVLAWFVAVLVYQIASIVL
jgi:ferrous iron transport protein B